MQDNLHCTRYEIIPLIKQITSLNNTKVIYQETPAYPGRYPLQHRPLKHRQNSFVQAAINYYVAHELQGAGALVVPAWGLSMPWCDELVGGRMHMMEKTGSGGLKTVPSAHVASYYAMHLACNDDTTL